MQKPRLVIITGRPGAGKSTLLKTLANHVHCPILSRDTFKEGYVQTKQLAHDELEADANIKIYHAFFEVVESMLTNNISLIIEAAFQHGLWKKKVDLLSKRADISFVICTVDEQNIDARIKNRHDRDLKRVHFHGEARPSDYKVPNFDLPTLMLDCTNEYYPSLDEVLKFINLS